MDVKREDERNDDRPDIRRDIDPNIHRDKENRELPDQVKEIIIQERFERFVETDNTKMLLSGNLNELQCFYQGDFVHERMAAVRESIYNIRRNWSKFDQFLANLKQFMESEAAKAGGLATTIKPIFGRKRNWWDIEDLKEVFSNPKEEFNVIFTYTTKEGFKEIFKISDEIFRKDSSVNFKDLVTNAVFLIELINVDLYNYVHKYPEFDKFEGIVYRGMAIPETSFAMYETLLQQPLNKRYISIPLGLWSSSMKLDKAFAFVKDSLKQNPNNIPLMLEIHVLNLREDFLQFYRNKFKNKSIVSTICAVPIHPISHFPDEAEVLLRGGFYQAINIYSRVVNGIECKFLVLVMLNSNRDHLSNPIFMNEEEDKQARALFGTMVGVTRNQFVVNYLKDHNVHQEDCEKYETLLKEGKSKLEILMNE